MKKIKIVQNKIHKNCQALQYNHNLQKSHNNKRFKLMKIIFFHLKIHKENKIKI